MNNHMEIVKKIIARVAMIPVAEVRDASTIHDLGVSSFDLIECILALEDAFQVELPREVIENARTVDDLAQAVEAALASRGLEKT